MSENLRLTARRFN